MRTDAWYNWHFWLWDIRSWLCHLKIRQCKDCRIAAKHQECYEPCGEDWCV